MTLSLSLLLLSPSLQVLLSCSLLLYVLFSPLIPFSTQQDNTGSMSPYIFEVQKNINNIIQQIVKSEKANVRFGLVHYRDHKVFTSLPFLIHSSFSSCFIFSSSSHHEQTIIMQDEYVVRRHEFSDDMKQIQLNVSLMEAAGGKGEV